LPREVVEPPSLELFKTCRDEVLGRTWPAPGHPAWAGRFDKMTSRDPFNSQPFCDSGILDGLMAKM